MQKYIKISKGGFTDSWFIKEEDVYKTINNYDIEWYTSVYDYTEENKQEVEERKTHTGIFSVAGIKNQTTKKLWWDFDSKGDITKSQNDVFTLTDKLVKYGIKPENICIAFSGNKGFSVTLNTNSEFNRKQVETICSKLAAGLETFDTSMYDENQVFRVIGTKHSKSGLYKTPLLLDQIRESSESDIRGFAKNFNKDDLKDFLDYWKTVNLPLSIVSLAVVEPKIVNVKEAEDIDWSTRPKFLTSCRWALQNGHFKEGSRSSAFLCLAATYKNLGYDKEITYRMLKGVAELQGIREGIDRYPDSEIYNNIVQQVYRDTWKNGQFTCREPGNWLYNYCQALGKHKCNHREEDQLKPKKLSDIQDSFKNYVMNIEKNTIHTGIRSLDEKVFLSTGANVGIIGAPGSGKTSIGLDIVSNTSKAGVHSVLGSLDMHYNRLFEKALYRVSGYSREKVYDLFRDNNEGELMEKLEQDFGNVNFFHKSSPTVSDLRDYIIACQDQTGEKIKLVMLDYFERISSDLSDDTAASKRVAGELQDLVNDLDICLVTLVQPNKFAISGGPDTPILDYTKIKGSSYVYQAFRIILSLWRPFYNPKDFSNDKYMQMAILKNDLGELAEFQFGWNGKRGLITELEDSEKDDLFQLLKEKDEKANQKPSSNDW